MRCVRKELLDSKKQNLHSRGLESGYPSVDKATLPNF